VRTVSNAFARSALPDGGAKKERTTIVIILSVALTPA
jgi:hypothetical protein